MQTAYIGELSRCDAILFGMDIRGIGSAIMGAEANDPVPSDRVALDRVWPTLPLPRRIRLLVKIYDESPLLFPAAAQLALGVELSRVSLDRPLAALIASEDDDILRNVYLQAFGRNWEAVDGLYDRRGVAFEDLDGVFDLLVAGYRYDRLIARREERALEMAFSDVDLEISEESRRSLCRMLIGTTISLSFDHPHCTRFIVDLSRRSEPAFQELFRSALRYVVECPHVDRRLIFDGLFREVDPQFRAAFVAAYWNDLVTSASLEQLLIEGEMDFDPGLAEALVAYALEEPPEAQGWFGYTLIVMALPPERRAQYLAEEHDFDLVINDEQTRQIVGEHEGDRPTLNCLLKRSVLPSSRRMIAEAIGGMLAAANARRNGAPLTGTQANLARALTAHPNSR